MNYNLFTSADWLSWVCSVALLALSLAFCLRKDSPPYMRSFPVYCLINVLSDAIFVWFPGSQAIIYLLFTFFELTYFAYLLSKMTQNHAISTILRWVIGGYFAIIGYCLFRFRMISFGIPEIGEVAILLPISVICLAELFKKRIRIALLQEPAFWKVTGPLFYLILLPPTLLLSRYYIHKNRPAIAKWCCSVNGVALMVSYLFFAKGITTWKTK